MAPDATSSDTDVAADAGSDGEDDERGVCSVCWAAPRCVVFLACGHCLLCAGCAARLLQQRHPACLLCRLPLLADDCCAAASGGDGEQGHVCATFQAELVDAAATQRAHARQQQLAAEDAAEEAQWGGGGGGGDDGDAFLPWLAVEGGETLRQLRDNEPALTALNLRGQDVGGEGAAALADALRCNGTLTELHLRDALLDAGGAAALAAVLAGHSALTRLDVGCNDVGAPGAAALAAAVAAPGCALTWLDVSECGLDDAAAAPLSHALRRGCSSGGGSGLTVLNLSNNFLSGRGAAALLAGGAGRGLRQLDLSANALCDGRAVAALCALLRESSILVHLDVSYNKDLLDNRSYVVDLCAALRACSQLRTLRLAGTAARGDGLALLCHALCRHPALTELDVSDTSIRYYGHGDAELALCDLLRGGGGALATVHARNIGLQEEHAPLLADALRCAGAALSCVDLGGNAVACSRGAAAALRAAAQAGLTLEGLPLLADEPAARVA